MSPHALTDAERARRYRDRKRGTPARQPAPCGTYAAYRRHQRNGEPIDDACQQAYTDYQREIQRARRAKDKSNDSSTPNAALSEFIGSSESGDPGLATRPRHSGPDGGTNDG